MLSFFTCQQFFGYDLLRFCLLSSLASDTFSYHFITKPFNYPLKFKEACGTKNVHVTERGLCIISPYAQPRLI